MPVDPSTGQMLPAQPIAYQPPMPGQATGATGPQGTVPVFNQASPGIGGSIQDAVRALAMALAPKSITQRAAKLKQDQTQAEGGGTPSQSQTTDLGNQF
jgi:hypothetical protein